MSADAGSVGPPPSFVQLLRAVAKELREGDLSPAALNRAASRIDLLGRHLHGLAFLNDHEIAGCLTTAVQELGLPRETAEAERAPAAQRSIQQLEAAVTLAAAGTRVPAV